MISIASKIYGSILSSHDCMVDFAVGAKCDMAAATTTTKETVSLVYVVSEDGMVPPHE